jgi:hypothetical protein
MIVYENLLVLTSVKIALLSIYYVHILSIFCKKLKILGIFT